VGTLFGIAKDHGFRFPDANGVQSSAPPTPEAVAEAARLAERKRVQREAEAANYRHRADEAAKAAAELWTEASEEGSSPYLLRKGVAGYGVRHLADGWLLLPMRNALGELLNVQRIAPAKPTEEQAARGWVEKRFLPGGRKSGLLHWLGDPAGAAVLGMAEGYATAASVHAATGLPVACCFDAGNLVAVAKELRPLYPAAAFLVCGDDDTATAERTGKNPGRVAAAQVLRAMKSAGAAAAEVFPDRGCNDWDDLRQAEGLDAVAALVTAAAEALAKVAASPDGVAVQTPAVPGADVEVDTDAYDDPRPEPDPEGRAAARTAKPRQAGKAGAQPTENNVVPLRQRAAKKSGAGGGSGGGDDGGASGGGDEEEPDAFDPFHLSAEGVFFSARNADGSERKPEWICARLEVTAQTRSDGADQWGYLLEFTDPDGNAKTWAMPSQMLAGEGSEWAGYLRAMGLKIAPGTKARNLLARYIDTRRIKARAICTDRVGWHGGVFVLPSASIGQVEGLRYVFQSEGGIEDQYKQRGELHDWQTWVAAVAAGNSRLVFALCCAFAGPLMRLAGIESGGFQFRGDSSGGKTTALKVAASVYGPPAYMQRWRTTDNALEATAVQHSDSLLILDEFGQLDPKVAGECAYMLANEQEKGRATRGGLAKRRRSWRLLFLSSGELGLADHMRQAGKEIRAGQEVRFVDLPLDAGAGMGGLEHLNGYATPQALAEGITEQAAQHYGTPGRAWVEWLAAHFATLPAELAPLIESQKAAMVPDSAAQQVFRVGNRFAVVAVAGELATRAGITGWQPGEAAAAVRTCFDAWLSARGHQDNGEDAAMLRRVRLFLEQHGAMRFVWWHRALDDHAPQVGNRAGFRRMVTAEGKPIKSNSQHLSEYGERMHSDDAAETAVDFFILPEVWRGEVCQGFNHEAVARLLLKRNHLKTAKGQGLQDRQRLPGMGLSSCYHVSPSIFSDEL
jgi:putative DNA primase/helicase